MQTNAQNATLISSPKSGLKMMEYIGTEESLMMYCQIAPRVYIAHTTPVVEAVIATR